MTMCLFVIPEGRYTKESLFCMCSLRFDRITSNSSVAQWHGTWTFNLRIVGSNPDNDNFYFGGLTYRIITFNEADHVQSINVLSVNSDEYSPEK